MRLRDFTVKEEKRNSFVISHACVESPPLGF